MKIYVVKNQSLIPIIDLRKTISKSMARLVQTHSTYIDGLIKWLKVLQKADGIKTITPGVISSTRGRSGFLTLKISRAIVGGFKVIARKGSLAQEVYIVTELSQSTLQAEIKKANPEGS